MCYPANFPSSNFIAIGEYRAQNLGLKPRLPDIDGACFSLKKFVNPWHGNIFNFILDKKEHSHE